MTDYQGLRKFHFSKFLDTATKLALLGPGSYIPMVYITLEKSAILKCTKDKHKDE